MQTITIILYPGCIFFELALAAELLATKYEIIYSTPEGEDHVASNGARIIAQTAYDKINLENCKGLLIPGGDPRSIKDNVVIDGIIQSAHAKGLWLAAICAGPSVLAKAGVLSGFRIAHGYGKEQLEFLKSYFVGVELTDEQFVSDRNIITAKPEAHIDFAVEIACRLGAVDASGANRTKEYYRGILGRKIRPLALALIKNKEGKYLFHKAHDRIKNEWFYRPLGGGIEFSESGRVALAREIQEELGLDSEVSGLVASFENIFTFEGIRGHEIIMLFHAKLMDSSAYDYDELDIYESGMSIAKAVWRSVAEIKSEDAKIYPVGLEEYL